VAVASDRKFLDSEAPTVEPLVSQELVNVPVSLSDLPFTSSPLAAETTSTLATSEHSAGLQELVTTPQRVSNLVTVLSIVLKRTVQLMPGHSM